MRIAIVGGVDLAATPAGPGLGRRPLGVGAALLAAFALLAVLVGTRQLEPVDLALMEAIHTVSSQGLDVLAGLLNYAAAAEVTLAAMALLSLWLLRRAVPTVRAAAPLLFLASLPIEMTLKYTLDQPVPSDFYRETLRYTLLSVPTIQSFPSGHAIRMAFMAVLLGSLLARRGPSWRASLIWIASAVLVLLSAWSRTYQGHHWPMDVLGGALLGGALGCFAVSLLTPVWPRAGR